MVQRRWDRIVNIASVAGMRAVGRGRTACGTSKAAVIGLTRQIATELAGQGVTANAISPGPVDTPMVEVLHSAAFRAAYTSAIPMKRYGRPSEIASLVSFLASEVSAYITGAVIPADGGFMAAGALGA
jgi:NAD(P)-dependent dehydrogenase (short-subunit alcohol dehydrogenase family)